MKITGEEAIHHSATAVFEALRDNQPELVRYLPNVEAVEVLRRSDNPPVTTLYNRWQGNSTDVPKALRPFVSREMMAWFDDASWNQEALSCDWTLESAKARGIFECKGRTQIVAVDEGSCSFVLAGDLVVHPEHLPGVPAFVGRRIKDPLERFVVDLLQPNLTRIAVAVRTYLDELGK